MKKWLVTIVLALAVAAVAQQAAPPQQRKEIKDVAEYNAYEEARMQPNPQAKAGLWESFLQKYPNTVMKEEVLELLMEAYVQSGNAAKTAETAGRLLQVNPNNIRGLALQAYTKRAAAESGQNVQQSLADARQAGERGLEALKTTVKPEGMPEADFAKFKSQTAAIFNGAVGIAAFQDKDYSKAQKHLRAAVETNSSNFQDIYPLALAYLSAKPPDDLNGLWFIARSASLAPTPQYQTQIADFGRKRYIRYHGAEDGWNQLLNQSKTAGLPPAGFSITPAPSPAEQARTLAGSKNPKDMDFGEWALILTEGEPAVADKVWSQIKGTEKPFPAKVIEATRTKLKLAATAEGIEKKEADVIVAMVSPLPVALVPKPGAEIQIQAKPESYTPKPFLMNMTEGQLIARPTPKAPAKKAPPPRRRKP